MSTTEDPEEGKKGVVIVINAYGTASPNVDKTEMWNCVRAIHLLPVRIVAIHYCHDSAEIHRPLLNLFVTGLDDNSRTRFREHAGKCPQSGKRAPGSCGLIQRHVLEGPTRYTNTEAN